MYNKKNKIVYLITFFIPFILSILCLLIGGFAPFGTKNIISAGNRNDFLPFFYEFYDHFHSNNLFFLDKTYGLGEDFISFATYYFSDPTNLIILLFPRTMLIGVINILFALKISAASVCCAYYLSYKKICNFIEISNDNTNKLENETNMVEKPEENIEETSEEKNKKKKKKNNDFLIGFKNPPTSKVRKFFIG